MMRAKTGKLPDVLVFFLRVPVVLTCKLFYRKEIEERTLGRFRCESSTLGADWREKNISSCHGLGPVCMEARQWRKK
jgi:hypothetical protein